VRTFGSLAVVTGVSAQEKLAAELEQDLAPVAVGRPVAASVADAPAGKT
jgi:hypothetical protein